MLSRSRKEALNITDIITYGKAFHFDDLETFILLMQSADEAFLTHHGHGS